MNMSMRSVDDRPSKDSSSQGEEKKSTQPVKNKNPDLAQKRAERIIDKSVFINTENTRKDENWTITPFIFAYRTTTI